MLAWPTQLETLYMVDRWQCVPEQKGDASSLQTWHDANYAAARDRVKPFGSRPVFLIGDTVEQAKYVEDFSLNLVYVDADHSYRGVMRDIIAWYYKLKNRGIMAFHDYENPCYGVRLAVTEFCNTRNIKIYPIPEEHSNDAGAFFYADPSK